MRRDVFASLNTSSEIRPNHRERNHPDVHDSRWADLEFNMSILASILLSTSFFHVVQNDRESLRPDPEQEPSVLVSLAINLIHDRNTLETLASIADLGPAAGPVAPIVATYLKHNNWVYRSYAATALSKMGPAAKAVTKDLVAAIGDEEMLVAGIISTTLISIGPPAVGPTSLALADPNPRVRRRAAETLGQMGAAGKSILPALGRASTDNQKQVREAALEAIRKINLAVHGQNNNK